MLVSTFELLVKPISPVGPAAVARTAVQGYFLTIANVNNVPVNVRLRFTATTPELNLADTVVIKDVSGNVFEELAPVPGEPKRYTYSLRIPAHDTGLVTLLPDVAKDVAAPIGEPDLITQKNLEIRGYVEIFVSNPLGIYRLLVTPEHRGTFLPRNLAAAAADFDQLAYALPTATGSSLYTLNGSIVLQPGFDLSDVLDNTISNPAGIPVAAGDSNS